MELLTPKRKRRLWIPAALFLGLLGVLAFFVIRGYWSPSLKDPIRSSEGVRCGYQELVDGGKPIRCVFVVDRPLSVVRTVLTDYDHFTKHFYFLNSAAAIKKDPSHTQFSGVAHYTSYDHWPFSITIEERQGISDFMALWDSPSKDLPKNRGNFVLRRLDAERTEITYSLELQVKYVPTFIVRNILLDQLPQVAQAAKTWIDSIPK